jgi:hypothetical protein
LDKDTEKFNTYAKAKIAMMGARAKQAQEGRRFNAYFIQSYISTSNHSAAEEKEKATRGQKRSRKSDSAATSGSTAGSRSRKAIKYEPTINGT